MSSKLVDDVVAELDMALSAIGDSNLGLVSQQEQPRLEPLNTLVLPVKEAPRSEDATPTQSASYILEAKVLAEKIPPRADSTTSPRHPIPALQQEFEESILESSDAFAGHTRVKLDAEARRQHLLELEDFDQDGAYTTRWRQKAGARFHPLRKLVAQISYGVHLIYKNAAISNEEVVAILQRHVDEMDSFVEESIEDFDVATRDISDRIDHLLLPLEHSRTFNRMLCDRAFRDSILEGNEVIERIIDRTTCYVNRSLQDIANARDAVVQLAEYLQGLEVDRTKTKRHLRDIYDAMIGNTEGWLGCFGAIEGKADGLSERMLRLGYIVDEVAKRCGIASRRKTPTGVLARKPHSVIPQEARNAPRSSRAPSQVEKPLPAPPLRISTNPAGVLPRASMAPNQAQAAAHASSLLHRPSLSSSPSLQTLDCLHRPSQRVEKDSNRPSSSSSTATPRTVRFQAAPVSSSPMSRTKSRESKPAKLPKSVSRQTSASPIIRHPEIRSSPIPTATYAKHSSQSEIGAEPLARTAVKQSLHSEVVSNTGLGIQVLGGLQHARASQTTIKPCDSAATSAPIEPIPPSPTATAPSSEPPNRPEANPLPPKSPRKVNTTSFSIFPTITDEKRPKLPMERPGLERALSTETTASMRSQAASSSEIAPTQTGLLSIASSSTTTTTLSQKPETNVIVHNSAISLERPPQILDESALPRTSSPKLGIQDADEGTRLHDQVTISDVPTLYTSHHPSSSKDTVSTTAPMTPEDPFDALRSHPVTPDMFSHGRKASITALPRLPSKLGSSTSAGHLPLGPTAGPEDDFLQLDTPKRPLLPKKASFASMRTLFSKKETTKNTRLGSAAIGGFVAVT